ncbi:MAG: phage holin, LLH family [Candidatus Gastranaerophilales bacterium]|nr:phage holin, LLH family [Candidatus Gastranaerophilales bacterium]
MFINLKSTITELAYAAVTMAEETLSTSSGQEKKAAAIEYIISMMPIPVIFKSIVSAFLSKFIDEAVENAVTYMKSIKNSEA